MEDKVYFKPGAALTFKSVVGIREQLYQLLIKDDRPAVCLDLNGVEQCDSAGLALLIEARKLCKKNNKSFEIKGIPPQTQSLAEFCGVRGILGAVQ